MRVWGLSMEPAPWGRAMQGKPGADMGYRLACNTHSEVVSMNWKP